MSEHSPTQSPTTQNPIVEGTTLSLTVVMAFVLFVMANYLSSRHYERFDWTEAKLYTLSEKSENVVRGLEQDVEAVLFMAPGSDTYNAADELLSRYAAVNPDHFKKRNLDPVRDPLEARRLASEASVNGNVIVLSSGDDRRVIEEYEMVEYDYSGTQYGQGPTVKEFKGEQLITSAILELVEAEKPRILFTTGHGEAELEGYDARSLSQARDMLGKDNFEISTWDSAGKSEVPAETDLVVVAAPQTPFFPQELEVFSNYLEAGGRMLVLLDPALRQETFEWVNLGLTDWLRGYGVEAGQNLVIDPATQLPFFGPETVMTDQYGSHPIVKDLAQTKTRVMFTIARTVGKAADAPERFQVTELVKTSSTAWGETNLDDLENVGASAAELQGSLSLGVAVSFNPVAASEAAASEENAPDDGAADGEVGLFEPETQESETETDDGDDGSDGKKDEARLVVFGDVDFAASQVGTANNAYLLLNTFNWLVQREQLISIEGRKPEETKLFMTDSELLSVFFLVMLLMPGLAVVAGIAVFMRRRR